MSKNRIDSDSEQNNKFTTHQGCIFAQEKCTMEEDVKDYVAKSLTEPVLFHDPETHYKSFPRREETIAQMEKEDMDRSMVFLELSPDPVIFTDQEGSILATNSAFSHIFGFKKSDLEGKHVSLIIPHRFHTLHKEAMSRFVSTRQSRMIGNTIEVPAIRNTGEEFPIELSLTAVFSGERFYYAGFIREITSRKEVERNVELQRRETGNLLCHVLPAVVRDRMKTADDTHMAVFYPRVTVLFLDPVWTLSSDSDDTGNALLTDLFGEIESFIKGSELELINSMGDALTVVGGMNDPHKNHAKAVLEFGFQSLMVARKYAAAGQPVNIRIGVNTGACLGGIDQETKLCYTVWGHNVIMAQRMATLGQPGRIQVTEHTYNELKDDPDYKFLDQGEVPPIGPGTVGRPLHSYFAERTLPQQDPIVVPQKPKSKSCAASFL